MGDSAADLAARIAEMERQLASLSLSSQFARSTVSVDGDDVLVSEALGLGSSASEEVADALNAADSALAQAAQAQVTADGRNRIFAQETTPDEDMVPGDLWYVTNAEGIVVSIRVFDGESWNPYSLVADSLIVPGSVGAVLIANGAITAPKIAAETISADKLVVGALDGQTLRGNYIEGPNIASSAAVGAGVNVLADPGFTSSLDTAWVASGYKGTDAVPVQTDTITWDQTAPNPSGKRVRYRGSVVADMTVKPIVRQTRELLHTHAGAVFATAPRAIANPYTFGSIDSGRNDSAFSKPLANVGAAPAATASTRTSYLTNSTVIPVTAGQSWQAIIKFTPMHDRAPQASVSMQLVDAVTGAVVWDRPLTVQEKESSAQVVGVFIADANANLRFRLAATYRAAGAGISRIARTGSYRRADRVDADPLDEDFQRALNGYAIVPLDGGDWPSGENNWTGQVSDANSLELMQRASTRFTLQSASLGTRSAAAGFTLKAESGLELFNDAGALTARLNGKDNFLAGVFATNESGQRVQLDTDRVAWFNNTGTLTASMTSADVATLKSRLPLFHNRANATAQPLATGWQTVRMDVLDSISADSTIDYALGVLVVRTAGIYQLSASIAFATVSTPSGRRLFRLFNPDTSEVLVQNELTPRGGSRIIIPVFRPMFLAAGTRIVCQTYHTDTTNPTISTGSEVSENWVSIVRI